MGEDHHAWRAKAVLDAGAEASDRRREFWAGPDAHRGGAQARDQLGTAGQTAASGSVAATTGRERRMRRGQRRPETFDFPGFTHICATTRETRRFTIRRLTSAKRMRSAYIINCHRDLKVL